MMMNPIQAGDVEVGFELAPVRVPALDRSTLALYAGASGDHMPLHIDIDVARKAGMPDVFGHGMLSAAWLTRVLTQWVPQERIRSLKIRFTGITHLYNEITCTGRVVKKFEQDGRRLAVVDMESTNQFGEVKVIGVAVLDMAQASQT